MDSSLKVDRHAFTLIELCVVIAILAVLFVLISRGFSYLQEASLAVSDVSNLRQIGIGAHRYVGDHNGLLPPVMTLVDGDTKYAHEFIAEELGITASLRATDVPPGEWGPFISHADKGSPPQISPLRSYGINLYMGEVYTFTGPTYDAKIARRYLEVLNPSQILYFLTMRRETTVPSAQARFSELTTSVESPAGYIRVNKAGKTVALWADGHASSFDMLANSADFAKFVLPKVKK